MKNYDESVKINHNVNWPYSPYHSYRILIIGGSGSGKTNVSLNLTEHQRPDIDKIYLDVKDPFELLINWREKGIEILKNPKAFIGYSQTNDDVYEHLENYNSTKKRGVLIVFCDVIADMESNKTSSPIVTELFLRGRTLDIFHIFISQSHFKMRLNATYFVLKILNKRKPQQISSNHLSDIDSKDFMKL